MTYHHPRSYPNRVIRPRYQRPLAPSGHWMTWPAAWGDLELALGTVALVPKGLRRLDAFICAAVLAFDIVRDGHLDQRTASDHLWREAETYGLVEDLGEDFVQLAISGALWGRK